MLKNVGAFFALISLAHGAELRMLDVGEGQSIVVSPDEKALGVIVDTGSFARAGKTVARLIQLGRAAPDRIVLTHLHPDHASGIFEFQRRFPKSPIFDNCHVFDFKQDSGIDSAVRWVEEFLRTKSPITRTCLKQGDEFRIGDVKVSVLWPPAKREASADLNADSLVLLVSRGEFRALLMGDAGKSVEAQLLARGLLPVPGLEVLVAGHHGASDAGSPEFLEKLQPKEVWISVNAQNHWGHALPEDIERYGKPRAKVRTTAVEGELLRRF